MDNQTRLKNQIIENQKHNQEAERVRFLRANKNQFESPYRHIEEANEENYKATEKSNEENKLL